MQKKERRLVKKRSEVEWTMTMVEKASLLQNPLLQVLGNKPLSATKCLNLIKGKCDASVTITDVTRGLKVLSGQHLAYRSGSTQYETKYIISPSGEQKRASEQTG